MKLPKRIKKPWGEELLFALTDSYAGKILTITTGHRLSLQYHVHKEETLLLLRGVLLLTLKKQSRLWSKTVKPGQVFHLAPRVVHRMRAIRTCQLVEVSTPELGDVVRVADDYQRC